MPRPFPSPWRCTGLVLTWEDDQHLNHHLQHLDSPGRLVTQQLHRPSPSGLATYSAPITQPIPHTPEISMWQLANKFSNCNSLKKQVVYHVTLPHRFPHTMGEARHCRSKASVEKNRFSLLYSKLTATMKLSAKKQHLFSSRQSPPW